MGLNIKKLWIFPQVVEFTVFVLYPQKNNNIFLNISYFDKNSEDSCDVDIRFLNTCYTELIYEGWNFNSGNYLFTTDTK